MKFIMDNLLLVVLAVVSGGMLLAPLLRRGAIGVREVSPTEAVLLINREHALVLDVRNGNEYASGHISDALNIPLADLEARMNELSKYKDKPVLVNCQGGVRSVSACVALKKNGFTQIYNLVGGVNAWMQAKLPVIKES
jgi:rhodanese-related sulfurtransferase